MFDIGLGEIMVLVVAALFVFGPDRLPTVAAQAIRTLRQMRQMAASARADIDEAIGPELRDLDVTRELGALRGLDPKAAVNRFLAEPGERPASSNGAGEGSAPNGTTNGSANGSPSGARLPSYDPDAT